MTSLPAHPLPRSQLSVPNPSSARLYANSTHSHPPFSAPPVPTSSTIAGPSRRPPLDHAHIPVRKRSLPFAARNTHPLQEQIDRLTVACEEHERVIRSSLSTIKHHLLTNLPPILDRLNATDEDAEDITSTLQQSMQEHIPPFQAHLQQVLADRASDVERMRIRTTPWRDVVSDNKDDQVLRSSLLVDGERSVARLERIPGLEGGDGVNALSRIEMWSDEVSLYLSSEIVRAKERIASKTSKRVFLFRLVQFLSLLLVAVILGLVIFMLISKGLDHFRFTSVP